MAILKKKKKKLIIVIILDDSLKPFFFTKHQFCRSNKKFKWTVNDNVI